MPAGNSQTNRPVIFIDPPFPKEPLPVWQQFLASMQRLPQGDDHFRSMTEWAQAVVDWKTGGEKGPAPERIKPELGPAPRAPQP